MWAIWKHRTFVIYTHKPIDKRLLCMDIPCDSAVGWSMGATGENDCLMAGIAAQQLKARLI